MTPNRPRLSLVHTPTRWHRRQAFESFYICFFFPYQADVFLEVTTWVMLYVGGLICKLKNLFPQNFWKDNSNLPHHAHADISHCPQVIPGGFIRRSLQFGPVSRWDALSDPRGLTISTISFCFAENLISAVSAVAETRHNVWNYVDCILFCEKKSCVSTLVVDRKTIQFDCDYILSPSDWTTWNVSTRTVANTKSISQPMKMAGLNLVQRYRLNACDRHVARTQSHKTGKFSHLPIWWVEHLARDLRISK